MVGSALASKYVPADGHGGQFPSGQPRIIVVHSLECPLGAGWASNLAVNWMQHSGLSVHYIVDPSQIVQCLDESLIAWGAGTVNSAAIHIEQSGYARFTRADWTTPDGLAQIALYGKLVADVAARHNIPIRWLSDSDLHAAWEGTGPGGLATHSDCTRVIGGTTHTDPGDGYPRDLLLAAALPPPAPQWEDDNVSLSPDAQQQVQAAVLAALNSTAGQQVIQQSVLTALTTAPLFKIVDDAHVDPDPDLTFVQWAQRVGRAVTATLAGEVFKPAPAPAPVPAPTTAHKAAK